MNPSSHPATAVTRATSRSPRQLRLHQPQDIARHADQPGPPQRESRATHRIAQKAARPVTEPRPLIDPPTPTPGTTKIKLELQSRTDDDLAAFGESHVVAMDGNPWFPSPIPSTDTFDARLAAFEAKLAELENHRLLGQSLTQQKDQLRQELEATFNYRANYVQLISRGNSQVIGSAGLSARRSRRRTGTLPSPTGLVLSVAQSPGQMFATWDTVAGARSFIVECAALIVGEPLHWADVYVGGKLKCLITDLTPGQHYAFRIATIGGSDGRSPWSPVVERMVA